MFVKNVKHLKNNKNISLNYRSKNFVSFYLTEILGRNDNDIALSGLNNCSEEYKNQHDYIKTFYTEDLSPKPSMVLFLKTKI